MNVDPQRASRHYNRDSRYLLKTIAGNFGIVALLAAFGINLTRAVPELDLPLVNPAYAFRQTQTALGIREFSEKSFALLYEIPTDGRPWFLPFEFPLYQWLSAGFVRASGSDIEVAGRLVSLLAHYLTVIASIRLLTLLKVPLQQSCCIASVLLLLPVYQFWGRSVMIESTALALGIVCAVNCLAIPIRSVAGENLKASNFLYALIFGSACGLVKITTFGVIFGFIVIQCGVILWCHRKSLALLVKPLMAVVVALSLSIATASFWTSYADGIKEAGRITSRATSQSLRDWNFGTLGQRFSMEFWGRWWNLGFLEGFPAEAVFRAGPDRWIPLLNAIFAISLLLVLAWAVTIKPGTLLAAIPFFIAFASGPIVFSNLYFVHSYYWFANIWLLVTGVLIILWDRDVLLGLWRLLYPHGSTDRSLVPRTFALYSLLLQCFMAIVFVSAWRGHEYSSWQTWRGIPQIDQQLYCSMTNLATLLPKDENEKGFLLVAGLGFSPEPAYHLARRTLCVTADGSLSEIVTEASQLQASGYNIDGVLEVYPENAQSELIIKSVLNLLRLESKQKLIENRTLRFTLVAPSP